MCDVRRLHILEEVQQFYCLLKHCAEHREASLISCCRAICRAPSPTCRSATAISVCPRRRRPHAPDARDGCIPALL